MDQKELKIEKSWSKVLAEEFQKEYFLDLWKKIKKEYKDKKIFPEFANIFHALDLTPFESVRVIIVGQDPYHGKGQAHGLAFSVPENIDSPPSLKNIFNEIKSDLKIHTHNSPNLERWAKQGVLLLNTTLTVEENSPASHKKIGWEKFTDAIIKKLSADKKNLVFILCRSICLICWNR